MSGWPKHNPQGEKYSGDSTLAPAQPFDTTQDEMPRTGATCANCGFSYYAHKGHIIPCPLCCGIVELAIRNINVKSYIDEWEGRALKAESRLAALREALQQLSDSKAMNAWAHDLVRRALKSNPTGTV